MSCKIDSAVWDGDNTIWDWMAYAVPAYEAMAEKIAEISGRNLSDTANCMKDFYSREGSLEAEGLIQGLMADGFFDFTTDFNLVDTILIVQEVFSRVRRENLHVYPGISSIMKEMHERGMRQLILTDATSFQAAARLKFSRLGKYIESIHAMPSKVPESMPKKFEKKGLRVAETVQREKPESDLEKILGLTREQIRERVVIIGDNLAKDMELAKEYDCLGIHAAYGLASPEMVKRIQKFAPERISKKNVAVSPSGSLEVCSNKIKTANSPEDILQLLL